MPFRVRPRFQPPVQALTAEEKKALLELGRGVRPVVSEGLLLPDTLTGQANVSGPQVDI